MNFLARLVLNGLALVAAAYLVRGITFSGMFSIAIASLIFGVINAIIRPVLLILTLPFTILTLGLFIFVVNALCLALTAALVPGLSIDRFGSAFLGALIVSIVSWGLNIILRDEEAGRS